MQPLQDLISSIADDYVRSQRDVDVANADRLQGYLPFWNRVRPVFPELAEYLIPPIQSLHRANVKVNFQVVRSSSQEFHIGISILNLGYSTKFQQARFGRCTIHVDLIRDSSLPRRPFNG
jgi:hypothetical protein